MAGRSKGGLEDGFTRIENDHVPPKRVETDFGAYPNPERMVHDERSGEMADGYRGGFVGRHPRVDNDRK